MSAQTYIYIVPAWAHMNTTMQLQLSEQVVHKGLLHCYCINRIGEGVKLNEEKGDEQWGEKVCVLKTTGMQRQCERSRQVKEEEAIYSVHQRLGIQIQEIFVEIF